MDKLYQNAVWISGLVSAAALGAVSVAQFGFNLQPCVLCVYQRWPYAIVIALVVLGSFAQRYIARKYLLLGCALAFAVTAAIAAFHVGVEQHWWQGTSSCTADAAKVSNLAELKAQILAAPLARCDEIAWQLFGISMAGYNFIMASLMALFAVTAAFKLNAQIGEEHD